MMLIIWTITKRKTTMDDHEVNSPMKKPPHPGQVLKGLYLEPLGLSVTDAAKGLGVTRKTLSQLINGHQSISPDMALRLAEAFNTTPQLWLNMQQNFDLRQAEQRERNYTIQHFWTASHAESVPHTHTPTAATTASGSGSGTRA